MGSSARNEDGAAAFVYGLAARVYHTASAAATEVPIYRGTEGWHVRGIGALAVEAQWPLIGPALGGIQRLVPRLQLVVTPPTPNLDIPNEDARAVDLEDSNLFALSRFPGYDRWEDGSRVTYGIDWSLDRPNVTIATTVGQSYRIVRHPGIFPEGTGLSDRFSDVVGRTRVRYGRLIDITHRFRVDKNSLASAQRLDLTVGSEQTYVQIGYLRLNETSARVEDLRDKESCASLAGSSSPAIGRCWATVLDLTGSDEDRVPCRWLQPDASGSASLMRTNAWSLAYPGDATMSASATSEGGAHSPFGWRSRASGARPWRQGC